MAKDKSTYDCLNCPGFCCSYTQIEVNKRSLKRLAKYFGVSESKARKKYTEKGEDFDRILKHQPDPYFVTICQFFDTDVRKCTIYEGRPDPCREYPGTPHCGFYDFLTIERERAEDPDLRIAAYAAE